jgi:hypothetical protein
MTYDARGNYDNSASMMKTGIALFKRKEKEKMIKKIFEKKKKETKVLSTKK